jgi:hypothetical protein
MRRSGTGNGGGLGMNKVVTGKSPKVEPRSQAIRPAGVAQIGLAVDPRRADARSRWSNKQYGRWPWRWQDGSQERKPARSYTCPAVAGWPIF